MQTWNPLETALPQMLWPSISLYVRIETNTMDRQQNITHNKKLLNWSEEQERPLFSVKNTVIEYQLDNPLPAFVNSTLSLGPKNSVMDTFDQKEVLAEVAGLLSHCKKFNISNETISEINALRIMHAVCIS